MKLSSLSFFEQLLLIHRQFFKLYNLHMGAFLIKNPNCVFIHIPKTAGASIRRGLFKGNYEGPVFDKIPKDWESLFKFCIVRNPYDRMVSAWKMFTQGMDNSIWDYQYEHELPLMSFEKFLQLATDDTISFSNRSTYLGKLRHHTIPQTHRYHCYQLADYIGKFEHLNKSLKEVEKLLDFQFDNLPHWNKTNRKPYQEYYNEKTYEIVSQYYKEDLEILDYNF